MTKLRYILEALFLGLISLIFRLMPVDMASACGGWIGGAVGPRLATSRKARRHVQAALPDVTDLRADAIIKGMWVNLGRVMAEYPHLAYIAQHRTQFQGGEILQRILDAGQGGIFVSGHLANWEVGPAALYKHFGLRVNAMYRAPNNPFSDRLLAYFRTLNGVIPTLPKSRAGGHGALQVLKNKGTLGILVDQKYNEGINVPFFGLDAMTNPIAVKFAYKFNVPVMPYFIKRTDGVNFEIHCAPPLEIEGNGEADVMAALHVQLEDWIKQQPEQWLWLHRRWVIGAE